MRILCYDLENACTYLTNFTFLWQWHKSNSSSAM